MAHPLFSAFSQTDSFGKLIFLGLYALSALTWIVLLHKGWQLHQLRRAGDGVWELIQNSSKPLMEWKLPTDTPLTSIYLAMRGRSAQLLEKNHFFHARGEIDKGGVFLSPSDLELIEEACQLATITEVKRLQQMVPLLSLATTLAPFLGLLGTVWGILVSFGALQTKGGFSSSQEVLGGISTALATTVLGLLIAIPALIGHSYLQQAVRSATYEMQRFGYRLLAELKLEYGRVE